MTAQWPVHWEQVTRGDRVFYLERYADGWHVICELSTLAIVSTHQAALAVVDEKGGGDG